MLLLLFSVLSTPVSLASALPRMLVVVVVLLLSPRCLSVALSLSRAPLAPRAPSVAVAAAAALHFAWPSSSPGGVSIPTSPPMRRPAHPPPVAWLAPSVVVVLVGAADGFLTLVSLVLLQSAASCRQLVPRVPVASGSFSFALP